jgi:hypothetical protein
MRRLSTFAAPAEEFKRCIAIDPAAQWGCTIGSFARADRLALLLFLHVEAEEFERLVVVDPAAPRMRVEQKDIIGLVGDFARKTRGALGAPRLTSGSQHIAASLLGRK